MEDMIERLSKVELSLAGSGRYYLLTDYVLPISAGDDYFVYHSEEPAAGETVLRR